MYSHGFGTSAHGEWEAPPIGDVVPLWNLKMRFQCSPLSKGERGKVLKKLRVTMKNKCFFVAGSGQKLFLSVKEM